MKPKVLLTVYLIGTVIILGAVAAQSESNDQSVNFYETCLENKISACQSKMMLSTSKSPNLRKTSALAAKQVVFYSSHKEMLVDEMIELEIGRRPYKVDYYLIKRYYEAAERSPSSSIAAK